MERDPAHVNYDTSQELMDLLRYTCETLSLEFTRWDEEYVSGPSLYFLVVTDTDVVEYADPLVANK